MRGGSGEEEDAKEFGEAGAEDDGEIKNEDDEEDDDKVLLP